MEAKTIHSNNISLVEVLAALRWLPPARLPGSVWIYADGTPWLQPPSIPGMSAPFYFFLIYNKVYYIISNDLELTGKSTQLMSLFANICKFKAFICVQRLKTKENINFLRKIFARNK